MKRSMYQLIFSFYQRWCLEYLAMDNLCILQMAFNAMVDLMKLFARNNLNFPNITQFVQS